MWAWLTHVVIKMARRSRAAVGEDVLGIGGVGGFVDTVGTTRRKRRSSSRDGHPVSGSPVARDAEVEERLEEILFGRKPVIPPVLSETDTDNEAMEEKVGL